MYLRTALKSFARNLVPVLLVTGYWLPVTGVAAELTGTTKKVQRNAVTMGGKRSSGASKAINATAGEGAMSTSAGSSRKVRKGHQAIRYYPATILNLSAQTGAAHGEASLAWTAPGADGPAGTASGYRLAYSTGPITSEAGFDAATGYSQSFVPLPSGATESRVLSGLPTGTTVYFAVKGIEPGGNRGRISNCSPAYVLAPAGVSGTAACAGTQGGKLVIAVFDSTRVFTTANLMVSTQLALAGGYGLTGIQPGTTFFVAGFVDVNQSLKPDTGEDYGFYGGTSPVSLNLASGQSETGVNFEILAASTAQLGTIAGNISYAGAQSG
ncbi:MAG: hypothetical protein KKH28_01825, partial [Elusimicrobia bacterium]|nr:hypothetical protein [Elusimicrobiota bacterium]